MTGKPPPGVVHHSDRGPQYAAELYRETLAANGLIGSMGRRGNPNDNSKAESFMKRLNVEVSIRCPSKPSRTSPNTFPTSSKRSATNAGSIQRSASPNSSRINTSARLANQQPARLAGWLDKVRPACGATGCRA
ncbi:DDE-type integrase/transposase/recombinase [Sinorhizobium fredii]|uniref:DDE-type integrase/transposase/recombinase n=1 Tax=Rhizobium fredii TaxID=380 RepID=A0A844APD0_RHIFR|nr:DDE-type integrase/transposase/recombinase [Sinorhizobium fredii]